MAAGLLYGAVFVYVISKDMQTGKRTEVAADYLPGAASGFHCRCGLGSGFSAYAVLIIRCCVKADVLIADIIVHNIYFLRFAEQIIGYYAELYDFFKEYK